MFVNTLRAVVATLETVEVKGRDNLDAMLGCILAVQKVADQLEKLEAEEEDGGEDNGG